MYIEYMILENLILFAFISVIYTSFLNIHMTKLKLILVIFFMTFFSIAIKIFCENSIILTMVLNIVYVYLLDRVDEMKKYVKRFIYYLVIFYLYIGYIFFITLVFKINVSNILTRISIYLISGVLLKISTELLWKMWIIKIKYSSNLYKVEIFEKIKFSMFLDTGNFASFRGIPVIIVDEKKYIKKLKKYKFNISCKKPYSVILKTINGDSEYKGYIVENIKLEKGADFRKRVDKAFLTFSKEEIKENIFDGILPFSIFIEK